MGAAAQVGAAAAQVGAGAAQVGAAAAHVGAAAAQLGAAQLGAAAAQPQPLLQPWPQRLWQRDLQHELAQQLVSQPHPLEPSIRSSRSKLKPWVQTAKPSTNDPRSEVHFIERRLLNDGTIELAHVPVRPDYVSAGGRAEGTRPPASRWTDHCGSPIAAGVLRGVRVRVCQVCEGRGRDSHESRCLEHLNRSGQSLTPFRPLRFTRRFWRGHLRGAGQSVQRHLPYRREHSAALNSRN